ncbi:type II toxin-antitoxin system RelE family toxin [Cupriavidus nantongensis]|uniref:Cytotoxic translational repressor of toxin-antitoxin stability system n=1 Tax=Cupriavidus nantongensis TaxID=1796606 RepID=A0A142JHV4_9BURK|nr:type II toxin-antitoxin system RelE/ParE family toxin [Cupriavidus nantongensis]AMR77666.1 cytotoxic translational repressor of toxin-antitoxin stability system [Cupriavidus nantongensis]
MNTITWSMKATRQLRKIADKAKRQAIYAEAQQLAHWPNCPGNIKSLKSRDDYRLRVGDYRVIFEIDQTGNPLIVTITQVEKRNERTY